MHKESKIYKELSREELNKIVLCHFGENDEYKAVPISGGLFNTTYRLSLLTSNRSCILRVGPVNRHLLLPFELNLMRAEDYVNRLMKEKGIPCSQILVCDASKKIIDRDYMIVDYIESKPLSEIEISEEEKEKLYFQTGAYTADIHKITADSFGRVSEMIDGKKYSTWYSYIKNEMDMICSKLTEYSIFTEYETDLFKSVIHGNKELLDEIQTPHLVHADLWAGNILIRRQGEDYETAAIIDADRAVFGDIDYDLSNPWIINAAFKRGYGRKVEPDEKAEIRMDIYRLLLCLMEGYIWKVEYDNLENSRNSKEQALQLIQKLII